MEKTVIKYNEEDLIKLNIKFMVTTGELSDLLFLTGVDGDGHTNWKLRARVFEEEIIRLNKVVEKLGGDKAHYILSEEDMLKAEKIKKEIDEFKMHV